jgi:hypothetical protein
MGGRHVQWAAEHGPPAAAVTPPDGTVLAINLGTRLEPATIPKIRSWRLKTAKIGQIHEMMEVLPQPDKFLRRSVEVLGRAEP